MRALLARQLYDERCMRCWAALPGWLPRPRMLHSAAPPLPHPQLLTATSTAEGLMLKSLAGPYEPSRRSDHWLKLKRWAAAA